MSREEALLKLKDVPYDKGEIKNDFLYIANKLEISTEQLKEYMSMPKKTHKDYKPQEKLYNIGAKVMNLLKLEKGGKR